MVSEPDREDEDLLGVTLAERAGHACIALNGKGILLNPFELDPFTAIFAKTLYQMCVICVFGFVT